MCKVSLINFEEQTLKFKRPILCTRASYKYFGKHCKRRKWLAGNKEICIERFYALLAFPFRDKPKRIATKPFKASMQKRIDGKRMKSMKK